jgi:hypothetical protein
MFADDFFAYFFHPRKKVGRSPRGRTTTGLRAGLALINNVVK